MCPIKHWLFSVFSGGKTLPEKTNIKHAFDIGFRSRMVRSYTSVGLWVNAAGKTALHKAAKGFRKQYKILSPKGLQSTYHRGKKWSGIENGKWKVREIRWQKMAW